MRIVGCGGGRIKARPANGSVAGAFLLLSTARGEKSVLGLAGAAALRRRSRSRRAFLGVSPM